MISNLTKESQGNDIIIILVDFSPNLHTRNAYDRIVCLTWMLAHCGHKTGELPEQPEPILFEFSSMCVRMCQNKLIKI